MRLLADGAGDLHWGGIDDGRALPAFLRRGLPLLRITAGIVAHRDHPPSRAPGPDPATSCATPGSSATPPRARGADGRGPSLASILERLRDRTGERPGPVLRAGAAGLRAARRGAVAFLASVRLPRAPARAPLGLKPLPLTFGRRRCRTGLVARRAAEDLAPVRLFEDIVRTVARERLG